MRATSARPRTPAGGEPALPAPRSNRGRLSIALAVIALCAAVAGGAAGAAHAATILHRGSHGTKVRSVQRRVAVHVDGAFGRGTERAVRRFQHRRHVRMTGRVDQPTAAKMGLVHYLGFDRAQPRTAPADATAPGEGAATVVAAARSKIGSPYAAGATGPGSFDCSGLVLYAFKRAGIALPRTSYDQFGEGAHIHKADVQAGDLVFFDTAGSGASHDGIAISPTRAISATSHGVMEHSIVSGYWGSHYVGARRAGR